MDKELLIRILGYLVPSNVVNLVYIPPAQGLRNAADAMEVKERDIELFKEFINNLK